MGLKETIHAAIASGFTALGNLKEDVTYKSQRASTYVPSTGVFTRVETAYTVSGVFLAYGKRDIDGTQIKPHDQKFLFRQAALAVVPALTDRLVRSTGAVWDVIMVSEDPAHATWELQIRGTNG